MVTTTAQSVLYDYENIFYKLKMTTVTSEGICFLKGPNRKCYKISSSQKPQTSLNPTCTL